MKRMDKDRTWVSLFLFLSKCKFSKQVKIVLEKEIDRNFIIFDGQRYLVIIKS